MDSADSSATFALMKSNIIIFDDDSSRRDSLSTLLNMCDDLACSGGFSNAANAADEVAAHQPQLVIMDINMPGGDGIAGTRKIKAAYPDMPVIIQTVFEDNANIFEALRAGANGYILKKTPPDKLLTQLREALAGGAPMTNTIAVKVLEFFKERPVQQQYNLSERERDILKLLAQGYSYKMLATECGIAYNTVCNHVNNIYKKLHVNSATEAVSLALRERLV